MADDPLPEAIIGRLSRMRTIESEFADRLDQLAVAGPFDEAGIEVFTRLAAVAARHRQALEEVAIRRGTELDGREATGGYREHEHAISARLENAIVAAASAVVAYGALYASARLLFENDVCDLADAHAAEWARERSALNDLLAPAVHGELVSAGLTCRCICPTCGIGACGCTRNSLNTIREHWGQPELEPGEGLELRLAPRPGSQLAEVGLERGDRIVVVDGEPVHTNPEIQRALRGRPIGESMTMKVLRAGEPQEIRVARVSDVPS